MGMIELIDLVDRDPADLLVLVSERDWARPAPRRDRVHVVLEFAVQIGPRLHQHREFGEAFRRNVDLLPQLAGERFLGRLAGATVPADRVLDTGIQLPFGAPLAEKAAISVEQEPTGAPFHAHLQRDGVCSPRAILTTRARAGRPKAPHRPTGGSSPWVAGGPSTTDPDRVRR